MLFQLHPSQTHQQSPNPSSNELSSKGTSTDLTAHILLLAWLGGLLSAWIPSLRLPALRSRMGRLSLRPLLGATTILFSVATAVYLFLFALPKGVNKDFALLLTSAITEITSSVLMMLLFLWDRVWAVRTAQSRSKAFILLLGLLPSLLCLAVTAAAAEKFTKDNQLMLAGRRIKGSLVIFLVFWILSIVLKIVYLLVLVLLPKMAVQAQGQSLVMDELRQKMEIVSKPTTATTAQSDQVPRIASTEALSYTNSDGNSSLRSSLSNITRPGSSRRELLSRSHSKHRIPSGRSSLDTASKRPSQDDGFDSWDTSSLSAQMRETVNQAKPLTNGSGLPTRLQTIPGSRSPSPAKALEGPFFIPSPDDSPPQSPLPQPPVSHSTSPTTGPDFTTRFPPATVSASPRPLQTRRQKPSRPPSLDTTGPGEEHIHPLFRTTSPTPPPSASSNTIVTAAPEAGELINRRMLNRMRSISQTPTTSPLHRSESVPNVREAAMSPAVFTGSPEADSPANGLPREGVPDSPEKLRNHRRKRSTSLEGILRDRWGLLSMDAATFLMLVITMNYVKGLWAMIREEKGLKAGAANGKKWTLTSFFVEGNV